MKKLRQKLLSIILIITLVSMLIPSNSFTTVFAEGSDTEPETYQISTVDQLFEFAEQVNGGNSFAGKTVQLTADITIPADREWIPIGAQTIDGGVFFQGTFDGQNHIISGLTIHTTYYQFAGFFSQLYGTVENLNFVNEVIESNNTSGDTFIYAGGICAVCDGTIRNCITFGTFSATGTAHNYAGGIAGLLHEGANIGMYDCYTNHASCFGFLYPASISESCFSGISDVSTTGLNLSTPPTVKAVYQAGNGYILWNPATSTLTLHNATISNDQDSALITLPSKSITINLVGENTITNNSDTSTSAKLIQQGVMNSGWDTISPESYSLTVSGNGTLILGTNDYETGISTDGTFIMNSGNLAPLTDVGFNLDAIDFVMNGGSLILGNLVVLGNASVTGGSILSTIGIKSNCNFTISDGTLKVSTNPNSAIIGGTFTKTGGTFNGLINKTILSINPGEPSITTLTAYGNASLCNYDKSGNVSDSTYIEIKEEYLDYANETIISKLVIPQGASLTVPTGSCINIAYQDEHSLSEYATIDGTLINNGEINLSIGTTQDDVNKIVNILKPTGTGSIRISTDNGPIIYTNSGVKMNVINQSILNLSGGEAATGTFDGYTFTGNNTDGYILTLTNLALTGNLYLPSGVLVTIQTNSESEINEIDFDNSQHGELIFTGTAPLVINGSLLGSGNNDDTITVQSGAQVTINGHLSIGASGGQDGTLNVDGAGSTLNVISESDSAV